MIVYEYGLTVQDVKIGQWIRRATHHDNLTVGEWYQVLDMTEGRCTVITNTGNKNAYLHLNRFDAVADTNPHDKAMFTNTKSEQLWPIY